MICSSVSLHTYRYTTHTLCTKGSLSLDCCLAFGRTVEAELHLSFLVPAQYPGLGPDHRPYQTVSLPPAIRGRAPSWPQPGSAYLGLCSEGRAELILSGRVSLVSGLAACEGTRQIYSDSLDPEHCHQTCWPLPLKELAGSSDPRRMLAHGSSGPAKALRQACFEHMCVYMFTWVSTLVCRCV